MIKAVIFDLDGTLIDSFPMFDLCLKTFSQEKGLPSYDLEKFRVNYKNRHINEVGWPLPLEQQAQFAEEYMDHWYPKAFLERENLQPPLFDGVKELLDNFSQTHNLYVATARDMRTTQLLLKKHKIDILMKDLVTRDCVHALGKKPKPAPDMLHYLMERNKDITINNAIVVGDADIDVFMAQAAGMTNIAITHGGGHSVEELLLAKPTHLVHNIGELNNLIRSLS
jgi:phosphoglycolate phosphatase-like HAD superfamily hydrolase